MNQQSNAPMGYPSFNLSDDLLDTSIDLLCRATADARDKVKPGQSETQISILVRKSLMRERIRLGISNLRTSGERELLDLDNDDPSLVGRLDIIFEFLDHIDNLPPYLAVECKRVAKGNSSLNAKYVAEGVSRFVSGKYSTGHSVGIMLGYVIKLPGEAIISTINRRICKDYGVSASLSPTRLHVNALSIQSGNLFQGVIKHPIQLIHIFVDVTSAANN